MDGVIAAARRSPLRSTDEVDDGQPRVLVVEPDERARSLLQAGLGRQGFAVIAATSGEEALRFLAPDRPLPGMIFCEADLRNGNGDGFSLCGQVRAGQRTADLPLVLLSHSPESDYRELAGGAGADQFLPKPLFLNDVVALARLMAGRSSSAARFEADTGTLPLPQLLRALLSGVRAGRIELERSRTFITFREGRVVDASCDGLRGEAALTRILLLESGAYLVTFGPALTRATLNFSLKELCRRMLPRLARWELLLGRGVPLDALLVADFARLKDAFEGLPEEVVGVLRLFDGRRTVREVVLDASLDEVTALEVVTRLYALSLVTLLDAPPSASASASAPAAFFEPAPRPLLSALEPPTPEQVRFPSFAGREEPSPVVLVEAPPLEESPSPDAPVVDSLVAPPRRLSAVWVILLAGLVIAAGIAWAL